MDIETIQNRLKELRENRSAGEQRLLQLDEQKRELQNTLLRISGAIQVLEELESESKLEQPKSTHPEQSPDR